MLHVGWHWTRKICHWPWHVKSTMVATYNFAASPFWHYSCLYPRPLWTMLAGGCLCCIDLVWNGPNKNQKSCASPTKPGSSWQNWATPTTLQLHLFQKHLKATPSLFGTILWLSCTQHTRQDAFCRVCRGWTAFRHHSAVMEMLCCYWQSRFYFKALRGVGRPPAPATPRHSTKSCWDISTAGASPGSTVWLGQFKSNFKKPQLE